MSDLCEHFIFMKFQEFDLDLDIFSWEIVRCDSKIDTFN